MIRRGLFVLTSAMLILGCSGSDSNYIVSLNNANIVINFDTAGNIASFQIDDRNIKVIVNVYDDMISSYSLSGNAYQRIANIDEEGNLISARETMPNGSFIYGMESGRLSIEKDE